MAGFTDEEISTAIDRFLLKQVQVPQLKTGARDILTLQARVYDLLTTAFLLRPDSYFYVIYLARNRLLALLSSQIELIDGIVVDAPNSTRASKRIKSTTDLSTAQAALFDLSAGMNARNTGVRGSIGPAVDRFRKSVASFVGTELTKNVLVNGQVTETGPELRQKIAAAWAEAVEDHAEIVRLAQNLSGAMSSLEGVRLPETSVRDIISRIQTRLGEVKSALEGVTAIEESRSAMLDLLTMRTLLTKASTFRNPELVLMPKTRDSSSLTFVDSDGVEASIEGTVSGPFNYDEGAILSLTVSGSPVAVNLPGSSRAELRSRVLSPWVAPTIGDLASFVVDFGATVSYLILAAYPDGPTAAATLDAAMGPSISVTWDAGTDQLVFRSSSIGDGSHLRLLTDTAPRQSFRDWVFPPTDVAFTENKGEPVSASSIAAAVGASSPLVSAAVVEEFLADFVGERTSAGGEEATIWDRRDSGSDLVSAVGVAVVTSPSRNFSVLGIRSGMGLHTTAPSVADYTITEVNGASLTLSPAPSDAGPLSYYIGPDYRSIPDGARVQTTSGSSRDNTGFYRVAAGGGQVARIEVDRNLQAADTQLATTVFTHVMSLAAVGTTTSAGIGVLAPSDGATALGLATMAAEQRPRLTRLQLAGSGDFLLRGVRAGDLVSLISPSLIEYSAVIESVTTTTLFIEQGAVFEPGNWTYEIKSSRADAFEPVQAGAEAFLGTTYVLRFSTIDTLVGRLIRGARYGGEIEAGLLSYRSHLVSLRTVLSNYEVPRERMIDNVVRTFQEQGLDRALDLLLTLEIEELFTMEPDGISYSTWLVRKAATVAREVVPVSKFARSDRVVQEWRTSGFQSNPFDPRGEDT